jgi:hypothetical protein
MVKGQGLMVNGQRLMVKGERAKTFPYAVIARSAATKQSVTIKAFSVRDCFATLAMTAKGDTMTTATNMSSSTNMSSLTGFLFAIALFATNMSSLTGFVFADDYNADAIRQDKTKRIKMSKREIKRNQMNQINQSSDNMTAKGNAMTAKGDTMTTATNMSSLTGFLFAIALFATNMSSLTGFLFADDYNANINS